MSGFEADNDIARDRAIQQVRRVASGILVALVCVFGATFAVSDPPTWVLLVRAMAEAGMVGGIADWFAVEALFRHPLGLPIPHTALLPSNQKRAADNIARFIDDYFLDPDQLLAQIRKTDPVHKLAGWLSDRKNAALISRELSHFLHLLVQSQISGAGAAHLGRDLAKTLAKSVDSDAAAGNITNLLKHTMHGQVLDEVLGRVHDVIDANRDKVTQLVQDRSRWWIASSVDHRIVKLLVEGILSILDELTDEDSELRREFEESIANIIDGFNDDGLIARQIDLGVEGFVASSEFEDTVENLMASVLKSIEHEMSGNPDRLVDGLAETVQAFSQHLLQRPGLMEQLNDRLFDAAKAVILEIRPAVTSYIARTIRDWDSEQLVERIEAEVGRDLQFIRINGSVLGAMVGGIIFVFSHFLLV